MKKPQKPLNAQDQLFPLAVPTLGRIKRRDPAVPEHQRRGWMRGKGFVRGKNICLPLQNQRFYSTSSREFNNGSEDDAIFAFLRLYFYDLEDPNAGRDREIEEVEAFVARYGLLTENGLSQGEEPLLLWNGFHRQLTVCMSHYWAIQEVLKGDNGDVGALNVLYDALEFKLTVATSRRGQPGFEWAELYIEAAAKGHFGSRNNARPTDSQRQNLATDAYYTLVEFLDALTENVYHRFSFDRTPIKARKNAVQVASVGFLASGPEAADLRGYLAAQMGYFMQDARPVRICRCGQFFSPKRTDQEYCGRSCAGKFRGIKHRLENARSKSDDTRSNLSS